MARKNSEFESEFLEIEKSNIFDNIISGIALAFVPIAIIIVITEALSGWDIIRIAQLAGIASIWFFGLAKGLMDVRARASIVMLVLLLLAMSEVVLYGFTSATFYFLAILPILATAGLGFRFGVVSFGIVIVQLILVAMFTITNERIPPNVTVDYFFNVQEWMVRIVNYGVAVAVGIFVTGRLFGFQRNAYRLAHEKNAALMASHRRLFQAAELAGLGYAKTNELTGEYIEVDEGYASIHGSKVRVISELNIESDMIGKMVHPLDREAGLEMTERLKKGQNASCELRHLMPDGEVRYIRKIFSRVNPNDPFDGIFDVVCQDVTETRNTQEHLLQSQKLEAIGKLTGGVAHDFNNILAVISGNLELLQLEQKNGSNDALILAALKAVGRGAKLSSQLLAFARKQPLSPVVLNVGRILRDTEQLLRVSAGEAVSLEIVCDGGLWSSEVDRTQLEAVILNIVVNAKDAMPEGGFLSIDVGNTRLDRTYADSQSEVTPGQYVCISITDSGIGMDAQTLEKAIDPFFTTKIVGKGTGLGLSMAFGFAKQSGGHLKLYSEPGQGTTVKLYIPRSFGEAPEQIEIRPGGGNQDFSGLSLILVEDNDDLRKTYEAQLKSIGFTVYSAHDGASALELAQTVERADVILSDVILPNQMGGREVVERLSLRFPDAIAIFMSGFTENSIIHQGRLDEGVTLLQKPFTLAELSAALARGLNRDAK